MGKTPRLPRARTDDLIVKELAEEVLVYDVQRDKAHCLNLTAAAVWRECDGQSTPTQIAVRLNGPGAAASDINEQIVWLALAQLSRDHLLAEQVFLPAVLSRMSRREAIRRIGIGAAISLPIVATITAPTSTQAGSCRPAGQFCNTSSQCCSGVCSGGTCLGGGFNRQNRRRRSG